MWKWHKEEEKHHSKGGVSKGVAAGRAEYGTGEQVVSTVDGTGGEQVVGATARGGRSVRPVCSTVHASHWRHRWLREGWKRAGGMETWDENFKSTPKWHSW